MHITAHNFSNFLFQKNQGIDVISLESISPGPRERIGDVMRAGGLAHVVTFPGTPTFPAAGISARLAQELQRLDTPGLLSSGMIAAGFERVRDSVLSGYLGIVIEDRALCGPAALPLFEPDYEVTARSADKNSPLSCAAVRYGAALPLADALQLSARLYFYNRLPPAPAILSNEAFRRYLDRVGKLSTTRNLGKFRVKSDPMNPDFLFFESKHRHVPRKSASWKLYIAPEPSALAHTFDHITSALQTENILGFKVARSVDAALRPDKIIIYGESFKSLYESGQRLLPALAGTTPHEIPFSHSILGTPLLSIGRDPDRTGPKVHCVESESWRVGICRRLATALLLSRIIPSDVTPWHFALNRLRHHGIDPLTWKPTA